eukprot:8320662-Heterocapsa_arctica.AAC.1
MSFPAAVSDGLPPRTIDVFSLDGLHWDCVIDGQTRSPCWASMRFNNRVCADRRPALGLRQRRAHSH